MGNKSRHLPFKSLFFKSRISKLPSPSPSPSPWPWPSCNKPRTLSFRLLDQTVGNVSDSSGLVSAGSCFTTSSSLEPESLSTTATSDFSVEVAMQAVSSKRLLFDGGSERSLSNVNVVGVGVPFEGSVAVEVESGDPYEDFRASMREMVEAEGGEGKCWAWFEEMLEWYLRMNKRWTHEYIIGAYWDLLLEITVASSCCSVGGDSLSSNCSCCSSSSSSYASCLSEIEEVKEEEEGNS